MPGSPDTIVVVDPNARFTDIPKDFWVQGPIHNASTGEYHPGLQIPEKDGGSIEVRKWSRIGLSGSVSARVWTTDEGVAVQLSLARPPEAPTHTPNVYPVFTATELEARLAGYEEALAREGLIVSLLEGRLKRVDMFCDVGLSAPFVDHVAGFQGAGLCRLSPYEEVSFHRGVTERRRKASTTRRRGDSYGVLGAEHQFVVYDKAAHLAYEAATSARQAGMPRWMLELAQERRQQPPGEAPPAGVARIEERHTTRRAVENQLGVESGAELVACYDALQGRFVEEVRSRLALGVDDAAVTDKVGDIRSEYGDNAALLKAMADAEKQPARAIPTFGFTRFLEMERAKPDGVEEFREMLRACGFDERQIGRALTKPVGWMRNGAGVTVGELFDDLVEGVDTSPYTWPSWTE